MYVIALKFRPFPPRNKIDMLDNLLEIEVAYNLLQTDEGGNKEKDAFDVHYDKLKTDIKVSFNSCYRMSHLVRDLSWDDFDFVCSITFPILLWQTGI